MRTHYDMMFARIDEGLLLYRGVAPQDEHDPLSLLRQRTDSRISEVLPSLLLVTRRLSLPYREDSVQEENSLFRPISEISLCPLNSDIGFQLLENISQTRLSPRSVWYRKCESHGSTNWLLSYLLFLSLRDTKQSRFLSFLCIQESRFFGV